MELEFTKNRKRAKSCPCGRSNKDGKFVPYVNHTGCGYCFSCDKTFLPELDRPEVVRRRPIKKAVIKPTSYIDQDVFNRSLSFYKYNNFIKHLTLRFGEDKALQLANQFKIGTSSHWPGATVFWQVTEDQRALSGKVIPYNEITGKRDQSKHPTWVHTLLNLEGWNFTQCLFGLHQLKFESPDKPIAIVEGEKTAVIMSAILDSYVWMSCGGSTGLNKAKLSPLTGRKIMLFPDTGQHEKWRQKARECSNIGRIEVSQLIEAIEKENIDLADVFYGAGHIHNSGVKINSFGYPEIWE